MRSRMKTTDYHGQGAVLCDPSSGPRLLGQVTTAYGGDVSLRLHRARCPEDHAAGPVSSTQYPLVTDAPSRGNSRDTHRPSHFSLGHMGLVGLLVQKSVERRVLPRSSHTSGFVPIPLTACLLTLKRARYVHPSTFTALTHDHKRSHARLNPFRRTDPIH